MNGLGQMRAGFTVSRRIGNAVARNRARRRLREVARQLLPQAGIPGADHIFIARPLPAERPFAAMVADARDALARATGKVAA
jgi:ribonuclease P protein component